jgi:hypothetical protein
MITMGKNEVPLINTALFVSLKNHKMVRPIGDINNRNALILALKLDLL